MSQSEIAELFQTTKQNISKHIKAIFQDLELSEEGTVKYKLTVQNEGTRTVERDYLREIKILDTYAKKAVNSFSKKLAINNVLIAN